MNLVKTENGAVTRYPYSATDLIISRRDISWPSGPLSAETLAEHGVYPVTSSMQPDVPQGYELVEVNPQYADGQWVQQWVVVQLTPEKLAAAMQATVAAFDSALTAHLDTTAQQRRYDNRITCMVRAGFPGPFQSEGLAFAAWCDACNASAYAMLEAVQAGTAPMPESPEAFVTTLPAMVWPT